VRKFKIWLNCSFKTRIKKNDREAMHYQTLSILEREEMKKAHPTNQMSFEYVVEDISKLLI
jgi:hypothetical protein